MVEKPVDYDLIMKYDASYIQVINDYFPVLKLVSPAVECRFCEQISRI